MSKEICDYKTGKVVGQGSYATVREAIKISTNEKYALKQISKAFMLGKEEQIINEIEILKKVSKGHPNIITLHDYFETTNNLYLVMDYCTGGELFDRICEQGTYYEEDAREIVRTVLSSVEYLHKLNIVHRDIKPENLLFQSKEPNSPLILSDFGLSRLVDTDEIRTSAGTPGYMAPEVFQRLPHGKPVDIWSIGVLTYLLLSGSLPFESEESPVDVNKILKADFTFDDPYWGIISDKAKAFISSLLVLDPSKRLKASEALQHPWFQDISLSDTKNDLLPRCRKGFNARKVFKRAIDVVKAVSKLSLSRKSSYASSIGSGKKTEAFEASIPSPKPTSNASSIHNLQKDANE